MLDAWVGVSTQVPFLLLLFPMCVSVTISAALVARLLVISGIHRQLISRVMYPSNENVRLHLCMRVLAFVCPLDGHACLLVARSQKDTQTDTHRYRNTHTHTHTHTHTDRQTDRHTYTQTHAHTHTHTHTLCGAGAPDCNKSAAAADA